MIVRRSEVTLGAIRVLICVAAMEARRAPPTRMLLLRRRIGSEARHVLIILLLMTAWHEPPIHRRSTAKTFLRDFTGLPTLFRRYSQPHHHRTGSLLVGLTHRTRLVVTGRPSHHRPHACSVNC
jgi:hypothetical protein